jgi:hypothetical protein
VDYGVPKYTIFYSSSASLLGLPIPETPDSFSLDCDKVDVNTHKETPQPSTSKDREFFLKITSAEPCKITQKELPGLIRDLELLKNKAELLSSG